MNFKKTKIAIVGAVTALAMAGGVAVLPAFAADDVAAQIAALMAQIQMLQAKLAATESAPAVGSYSFDRNLTLGSTGADVMNLQKVLNSDVATQVAASGVGSAGNESSYFGGLTKAAVMKFQAKYGISPVAGYVGPMTRAKLNSMSAPVVVAPVTPGTPATPGVAGSLVVTAASQQPANALAPLNGTRIPFTKFTVTAGATDVPVSSVTVERTGTSIDAALDSIVLLDENGDQIGISKTLNSSHRATVGDPIVVKAGTSRTFTIGANRPAAAVTGTSGTLVGLDVVGINTTASLAGAVLPIKGAVHTINDSLVIGTVTMSRGGIDPGSSQTKEIGTLGYTFSSIKVTAGSAEAMTLKSIRWNQIGSAGVADMANLKTYVDGVAYDAVTTDGGKYYTSTFGNGIMIDKGFSKDISIKGDIVGGSSRTIAFDIAKRTDLNLVGNVYGYGILAPQTSSCSSDTTSYSCFRSVEDPWYRGSIVTMSNGTMTVSSDSTVAAQNIAVNLANQVLGGWSVEVRGEPISVGRMVFNVNAVGDQVAHITNVVLADQNGSVLAGPVDGVGAAATGTFTFTDSVTFPAGVTKLVLKGKISNDFVTNDTIAASTTPSTQWTTVRGQVTGNAVTASPASALTGNTMTVKAGALAISVSSQPVAQTVVAGVNQYEFARYVLDAGQSGEDVRLTSFIASSSASGASVVPTSLTSCQLYDGATSLTTGGNVVNPSANGDQTFTFDGSGLVVPKGTSKTLSLKCNVASGVAGNIVWGLNNNATSYTAASGISSGQTVEETMTASAGQNMTLAASGSYTVAADTSAAYAYRVVRAGTEVALGAFRFTASINEDVTLRQVVLALGNTASNSPADLAGQQVTLWDGATQVGVAQFTTSDYATSTLTSAVLIPKGGTKTLVVKGTMAAQDAVNGTPGAFIAVNYDGDNNGLNGNYATGAASGATISGTSADVSTMGVRVFRNVPSFTVTSTSGTFNGDTYKFTVSNPGDRDMSLKQLTFSIATRGGAATGFRLYSDGVAVTSASADAPTGTLKVAFDTTPNVGMILPAGSSKSFVLKCESLEDIASVSEEVRITLLADTAYPSLSGLVGTGTGLLAGNNIVWSPMSTTTEQANTATIADNLDWTNGYGLPGFPAPGSNMPTQTWTQSN